MNIDPYRYWEFVQKSEWNLATQCLNVSIEREPTKAPHYANRGVCLLALHRLEEALNDFQKACELKNNADAYPIKAGVILWWLNRPSEAIQVWRLAVNTQYTDAAGGIEIPALLFFAGFRMSDTALEKEGLRLLRKCWKPRIATTWPGPIAGFLLGQLDEAFFLSNFISSNPTLEARRMSQAHFWIGFNRLRTNDREGYAEHLQTAGHVSSAYLAAVILEAEYWLAQAELELARSIPLQ